MSLAATGTQLPWHDPGASEEDKCCCCPHPPFGACINIVVSGITPCDEEAGWPGADPNGAFELGVFSGDSLSASAAGTFNGIIYALTFNMEDCTYCFQIGGYDYFSKCGLSGFTGEIGDSGVEVNDVFDCADPNGHIGVGGSLSWEVVACPS